KKLSNQCDASPTAKSKFTDVSNYFKQKGDLFSESEEPETSPESVRLRVHNPVVVLKDSSSLFSELRDLVEKKGTRRGGVATEA
ncbi:hypothetical protein JDS69_30590, partial [Bacillus cereus]|nr:hypothetical protein [Bacillus cereus]